MAFGLLFVNASSVAPMYITQKTLVQTCDLGELLSTLYTMYDLVQV